MAEQTKKQSGLAEGMLTDCPRCGEQIIRTLAFCPHCKAHFTDAEKAELNKGFPSTQTSCALFLVMIAAAGFLIYLIASQLSANADRPNYEVDKMMLEQMAKQKVRAILRDPGSAQFSGLIAKPSTEEGRGIVCGYVNSRNGFGGMTGPQQFIVADAIFLLEEQASAAEMQRSWDLLCKPL